MSFHWRKIDQLIRINDAADLPNSLRDVYLIWRAPRYEWERWGDVIVDDQVFISDGRTCRNTQYNTYSREAATAAQIATWQQLQTMLPGIETVTVPFRDYYMPDEGIVLVVSCFIAGTRLPYTATLHPSGAMTWRAPSGDTVFKNIVDAATIVASTLRDCALTAALRRYERLAAAVASLCLEHGVADCGVAETNLQALRAHLLLQPDGEATALLADRFATLAAQD